MLALRRLSLNPDVGLKIEIVPKLEGINHRDSSSTWTYQITNPDKIIAAIRIPAILESKANEGLASSCNDASALPMASDSFDAYFIAWRKDTRNLDVLAKNGIIQIIIVQYKARYTLQLGLN